VTYSVRVVADSVGPHEIRITTVEATFPRFILAELNTHRMLSRNSASSRAIPTTRLRSRVTAHPFMPIEWGSNRSGMSAGPEIPLADRAAEIWLRARNDAVDASVQLLGLGVHKQITNRLLEPFMWHTAVITATDWNNFLHLRTQADAQPEFRKLALLIEAELNTSTPVRMHYPDWHLPYVEDEEKETLATMTAASVSAARCARVSYLNQDRRDLAKDIELADRLIQNGHMSPFEHTAQCLPVPARWGNFIGWKQYRKFIPNEADPKGEHDGPGTD
jgi:thymidylate synthase ThyX